MRLSFDFFELARITFQEICEENQLSIVRILEDLVGLRRNEFIILIGVDIDGIYVNYFNSHEKYGYDLVSFLLDNRRSQLIFTKPEPEPDTHREFIFSHLSAIAKHLKGGGKDILKGEKTWQESYKPPMVSLPGSLTTEIFT